MSQEFLNNSTIATQSAGEMLRQARLSKKLSVAELSKETRISKSMIEALEKGEANLLPGRTYETGYIRLICNALKEESDYLISKWIDEHHTENKKTEYIFPEDQISEKRIPVGLIGIIMGVLILASYGIWFFSSVQQNQKYNNISEIDSEINQMDQQLVVNEHLDNTDEIKPEVDSINEADLTQKDEIQSTENMEVNSLINNENRNLNSLKQNITNIENLSKVGKKTKFSKEILRLKGIEDSWLQIYLPDGQIFFSGMLKKGEIKPVPKIKDFVISFGNAGSVALETDDLKYEIIGGIGEIIQSQKLDEILSVLDEKLFLNQD